ncbi:hypothetical protein HPB51_013717 [Rhipicephalus microplus]|uniref:Uncharacterized protein n=1 Tax=Rhipicephalus microplus TaxID=6941 RepID=A0A9J6F3E2_RHIMP|nr:hypothetical protein HPB51_013717 [Rhipicephalus microplus]
MPGTCRRSKIEEVPPPPRPLRKNPGYAEGGSMAARVKTQSIPYPEPSFAEREEHNRPARARARLIVVTAANVVKRAPLACTTVTPAAELRSMALRSGAPTRVEGRSLRLLHSALAMFAAVGPPLAASVGLHPRCTGLLWLYGRPRPTGAAGSKARDSEYECLPGSLGVEAPSGDPMLSELQLQPLGRRSAAAAPSSDEVASMKPMLLQAAQGAGGLAAGSPPALSPNLPSVVKVEPRLPSPCVGGAASDGVPQKRVRQDDAGAWISSPSSQMSVGSLSPPPPLLNGLANSSGLSPVSCSSYETYSPRGPCGDIRFTWRFQGGTVAWPLSEEGKGMKT